MKVPHLWVCRPTLAAYQAKVDTDYQDCAPHGWLRSVQACGMHAAGDPSPGKAAPRAGLAVGLQPTVRSGRVPLHVRHRRCDAA